MGFWCLYGVYGFDVLCKFGRAWDGWRTDVKALEGSGWDLERSADTVEDGFSF